MQRTYRERKHYCGDYLEVEIFPVYTKAKGRGKRKKPPTSRRLYLSESKQIAFLFWMLQISNLSNSLGNPLC